jgi:hypothetical protein
VPRGIGKCEWSKRAAAWRRRVASGQWDGSDVGGREIAEFNVIGRETAGRERDWSNSVVGGGFRGSCQQALVGGFEY